MKNVKGLLPQELYEALLEAKEIAYPGNSGAVRNSFFLGNLIDNCSLSPNELKEYALNAEDMESTATKAVTYTLREASYCKLKQYANDTELPVISCVRGLLYRLKVSTSSVSVRISPAELTKSLIPDVSDNAVRNTLYYWSGTASPVENNDPMLKKMYSDSYKHFDVACSCYKMYVLFHSLDCSSQNRPLYYYDSASLSVFGDTAPKRFPALYKSLKKDLYAVTYINYVEGRKLHCGNRTQDRIEAFENLEACEALNEYATLSYSLCGMVPCPSIMLFNERKGIMTVTDTLPEMLTLLANWRDMSQAEKDRYNAKLTGNVSAARSGVSKLSDEMACEYIKWLHTHRSTAFLEDFYRTEVSCDGEITLIPTLNVEIDAVTSSMDSLIQYISQCNTLLRARAYRLACKFSK